MKTVMPLPQNNQIIIFQALVGLRETGYQPNNVGPGLEIIPRAGKGMALVHMNDVMLGES